MMLNTLPIPPKKYYGPIVSDMTSPTTRQYSTAPIPPQQLPVSPMVSGRVPFAAESKPSSGVSPQAAGVGAGIAAGGAIGAGAQGLKSYWDAKNVATNAANSSNFAHTPVAPTPGTGLVPVDGTHGVNSGNTNADFRGPVAEPPANIALRRDDPWLDAKTPGTSLRINPSAMDMVKGVGKAGLVGAGAYATDKANDYMLNRDIKNGAFTDNASPLQNVGTAGRLGLKALSTASSGEVPEMLLNAAGLNTPSFTDSPVKKGYDWATKSKNELADAAPVDGTAGGHIQAGATFPPKPSGDLTPEQINSVNAMKPDPAAGDANVPNLDHRIRNPAGPSGSSLPSPYSETRIDSGNGNFTGIVDGGTLNHSPESIERIRQLGMQRAGVNPASQPAPVVDQATAPAPVAQAIPAPVGAGAVPGQGSVHPIDSDAYRKEQTDIVAARRAPPEAPAPVAQALPRYQPPAPDYSGQIQAGLDQINNNTNSNTDSIGTMVANKSKRNAGQAMVEAGQHAQALANASNEHNIDRNISQNNLQIARGDHESDRAELRAQHDQAQRNFESTALASKAQHDATLGMYEKRFALQDAAGSRADQALDAKTRLDNTTMLRKATLDNFDTMKGKDDSPSAESFHQAVALGASGLARKGFQPDIGLRNSGQNDLLMNHYKNWYKAIKNKNTHFYGDTPIDYATAFNDIPGMTDGK